MCSWLKTCTSLRTVSYRSAVTRRNLVNDAQVCMDDRVVAELGPGSYFGENALTHYRVVRNTSMRAKTQGTVTMIPNTDARRSV